MQEVPKCRDGMGATEKIVSSGDRKSTRLNSSHSQISYAVFCLKKKTDARTALRVRRLREYRPPTAPPRSRGRVRALRDADGPRDRDGRRDRRSTAPDAGKPALP